MLFRGVTTSIVVGSISGSSCSVYDESPLTAAQSTPAAQVPSATLGSQALDAAATLAARVDIDMDIDSDAPSKGPPNNAPHSGQGPQLPIHASSGQAEPQLSETDAGPSSEPGGSRRLPPNPGDVPLDPSANNGAQMNAAGSAALPPPPPPPPVAMQSPQCRGQLGYVSAAGHCYFTFAQPVTWYVARDQCQQLGAHLATITSDAEQAFVASIGANTPAWLGLSRFGAPSFNWITGEVFAYTNWQADSPHPLPESGVLTLPGSGMWTDRPPTELHPALCEAEPIPT
jgi:Lectin C-type domain